MNDEQSSELERLRAEVASLRQQLAQRQQQQNASSTSRNDDDAEASAATNTATEFCSSDNLTREQVERYSRQALLPECGPDGTRAFLTSRVVVVGCGGLGSTAIMFLAASGVGHLVLVDADVVDRSNLHRQIIHTDARVGMAKVESAKLSVLALNPTIRVDTFNTRFGETNAEEILDKADLVLDCTDNVSARYVVNDACVRRGLPLVSGAAMRWDGQLSVYNVPLGGGSASSNGSAALPTLSPTYRCMHPQPPPVAAMGGGCNDIGVFGPVPGIIGCLQALEGLKTLIFLSKLRDAKEKQQQEQQSSSSSSLPTADHLMAGRMLVWDAHGANFRTIKMRLRTADGVKQSTNGELKELGGVYDGCAFQAIPTDGVEVKEISPADVRAELVDSDRERRRQRGEDENDSGTQQQKTKFSTVTLILDLRATIQFRLCNLGNLYELPLVRGCSSSSPASYSLILQHSLPYVTNERRLSSLLLTPDGESLDLQKLNDELGATVFASCSNHIDVDDTASCGSSFSIRCLCRRGRDSLRMAVLLEKIRARLLGASSHDKSKFPWLDLLLRSTVQNITGGLNEWHRSADQRFPFY